MSRPSGRRELAPASKIAPARRVAFEILTLVGEGNGHSDELLYSARTSALSAADRNLVTALVMGVLRWQIALDAEISRYLSRPDQRLAQPVALALRIGAFQLRHMDRIPPHAALSDSVELCRAAGQPHAAGMVNAILRRISTASVPGVPLHESPERFSQRLAHPLWLIERWIAQYGRAATLAICEYDQKEPAPGQLFSPSAENESLPEIDDGSRLVAELAAAAAPAPGGRALRVWDACAAPGGKTLILAARLPAAEILATDVSQRRLDAMRRRFGATPSAANINIELADASAPPDNFANFDLILCDLPCSGTGTLARNPEIRLRLTPADFRRQSDRQLAILRAAASRLAPGGRLLYSTCSLEPEENEQVTNELGTKLRQLPVKELVETLHARGTISEAGWEMLGDKALRDDTLRTLPGVIPCDGFFAAAFERPSS